MRSIQSTKGKLSPPSVFPLFPFLMILELDFAVIAHFSRGRGSGLLFPTFTNCSLVVRRRLIKTCSMDRSSVCVPLLLKSYAEVLLRLKPRSSKNLCRHVATFVPSIDLTFEATVDPIVDPTIDPL